MKFGVPPFNNAEPKDSFYTLLSKRPKTYWKCAYAVKQHLKQGKTVSEDFIDLINIMLSPDLTVRPASIQEVLEHPYFSSEDLSDV